jgi:hypothetical protein
VHLLGTCADVSKLHPGAALLPHFMPFTWCYPYIDVTFNVGETLRVRPSGPGIRFCDRSTSLDTVFGAVFRVDSLPLARILENIVLVILSSGASMSGETLDGLVSMPHSQFLADFREPE